MCSRDDQRPGCRSLGSDVRVSSSRSGQHLAVGGSRRRDSSVRRRFTCLTCQRLHLNLCSRRIINVCWQTGRRDARLSDPGTLDGCVDQLSYFLLRHRVNGIRWPFRCHGTVPSKAMFWVPRGRITHNCGGGRRIARAASGFISLKRIL